MSDATILSVDDALQQLCSRVLVMREPFRSQTIRYLATVVDQVEYTFRPTRGEANVLVSDGADAGAN
ncbi:MAG: hypothetical protein JW850_12905 [Thermoflexales bacterium]|nr:hypothetical protein [Thermoflexales bacterium]